MTWRLHGLALSVTQSPLFTALEVRQGREMVYRAAYPGPLDVETALLGLEQSALEEWQLELLEDWLTGAHEAGRRAA